MSWFRDETHGHEGYVAGYVEREVGSSLYRELAYPSDKVTRSDVRTLSAACTCGWRSPHFSAAPWPRAQWVPFALEAADIDQDKARQLWDEHALAVRQARANRGAG